MTCAIHARDVRFHYPDGRAALDGVDLPVRHGEPVAGPRPNGPRQTARTPKGVVVLLHGLTDSPFSLRHVATLYRDRGFAVVAIRMPGHGTVPAGLTHVPWEDWSAATELAVREARRRVPAPVPLPGVGLLNGGPPRHQERATIDHHTTPCRPPSPTPRGPRGSGTTRS